MAKVFQVEDVKKSDFRGMGTLLRLVGEDMGAKNLGIVMLEVKPNMKSTRIHYHPDAESVFFVIEGTGTITVEGEEHHVGPGTVAYMAPGETHGLMSTGNTVFKMIEVFTPLPIKRVNVQE